MMVQAFVKGLVFGITMAAIPGPIFFLIIQRTLSQGFLLGLACGLGAVTADTVYALVAAIGLTFVMELLLGYQAYLAILGGLFLIYLGIKTFFNSIKPHSTNIHDNQIITAWFTTFLLTLANPVTILSYCIIFAGLGMNSQSYNVSVALSLVGGVIIGASSVVLLLVSFLHYYRKQLSPVTITRINKVAAIILVGFGLAALFRGVTIKNSVKQTTNQPCNIV